jgi:hypothetical protein
MVNVVVEATAGGVKVTLAPVPEIVPPLGVQEYVGGSPSASVAVTLRVLVWMSVMESGLAAGPAVIWGAVLWRVTLTDVLPVAVPPWPSLIDNETVNVVVETTAGGVKVTLAPVPEIVPPLGVQEYVRGSPSASVAVTLRVLVWISVIESGFALGPAVICGAVLWRVTLTDVLPVAVPPWPSVTDNETVNVVADTTAGGVKVTLAPLPVIVPPLGVQA